MSPSGAPLARSGGMKAVRQTTEPFPWKGTLYFLAVAGAGPGVVARVLSMDWHGRTALLLTVATIMALAPAVLLFRGRRIIPVFIQSLPLLAYALICIISSQWSAAPRWTFVSGVILNLAVFSGLLAGMFLNWREIILGLVWATLILSVGSILSIPAGGVMVEEYAGAMRGLWPEKNEAGSVFAIGAVAAAIAGLQERRLWWFAAMVWLLASIVLTQSATSLASAIAAIGLSVVIHIIGAGPRRLVVGLWAGLTAGSAMIAMMITNFGVFLNLLGRDSTLTGRSAIWAAVMRRVEERPMFGWGYASWWSDDNVLRPWLIEEVKFKPQSAHNSALEILVGTGMVGLSFMLGVLLVVFAAGVSRLGIARSPQRHVLAFIACILILGISESTITGPEGLTLVILSVMTARVSFASMPPPPPHSRAA